MRLKKNDFNFHCRLFVEKLPKHPDFKTAPPADVSAIKKVCIVHTDLYCPL